MTARNAGGWSASCIFVWLITNLLFLSWMTLVGMRWFHCPNWSLRYRYLIRSGWTNAIYCYCPRFDRKNPIYCYCPQILRNGLKNWNRLELLDFPLPTVMFFQSSVFSSYVSFLPPLLIQARQPMLHTLNILLSKRLKRDLLRCRESFWYFGRHPKPVFHQPSHHISFPISVIHYESAPVVVSRKTLKSCSLSAFIPTGRYLYNCRTQARNLPLRDRVHAHGIWAEGFPRPIAMLCMHAHARDVTLRNSRVHSA